MTHSPGIADRYVVVPADDRWAVVDVLQHRQVGEVHWLEASARAEADDLNAAMGL